MIKTTDCHQKVQLKLVPNCGSLYNPHAPHIAAFPFKLYSVTKKQDNPVSDYAVEMIEWQIFCISRGRWANQYPKMAEKSIKVLTDKLKTRQA